MFTLTYRAKNLAYKSVLYSSNEVGLEFAIGPKNWLKARLNFEFAYTTGFLLSKIQNLLRRRQFE